MRAADRVGLAIAIALGGAALSASTGARADDSKDAARLFEEGRRLFDARRFEEACDALTASARLEARVGTLGMLGACEEQIGKPATASRAYAEAAELAHETHDEREGYARARAALLARAASRIRLRFAEPIAGREVRVRGTPVAIGADGTAIVDPGRVDVLVRAPGRRDVELEVDVARAATADVDVPPLEATDSPEPAPAPMAGSPPLGAAPSTARADASPRRAFGVGLAVLGGASVATGIGFGIATILDKNASSPYCDASDRCSPRGGAIRDRAAVDGNIATAALAVGAAALVGGIVLFATAPASSERPSLSLATTASPTGGGLSLRGGF